MTIASGRPALVSRRPVRFLRLCSVGPLVAAIAMVPISLATSLYAAPVSPRRLVEVVDLGNPVISPDGRLVAFRTEQASVERNGYDTTWYVQGTDGKSPPLRVAHGGVPLREYTSGIVKPSPALWSKDGRYIYYRALIDGEVSVWRADATGASVRRVTDDAADVRDFSLSEDGKTLLYSVGATRRQILEAERAEYERGVRIDARVFIGAGLWQSSVIADRAGTQRFVGSWFTTGPLLADAPDQWKAVDLQSMRLLDGPQSNPSAEISGLSELRALRDAWKVVRDPSGDRVATLTRVKDEQKPMRAERMQLAMVDRRGQVSAVCAAEACQGDGVSDVQWRPGSDELLFTVTDRSQGRAQSMYRWDTSSGVVSPLVAAEGVARGSSQRPWDIPCAVSEERVVCVTAHADGPPRLESVSITDGQRQVLFDPNAGLRSDIAARTPSRLLRWNDVQGREFTGHLFDARKPGKADPPPLFVTFYTCDGFLRGGLGDEWPLASMADSGISALCINGLPGRHPDVREHYNQGLLAVESVVRMLSDAGVIDARRVGMGGLSYGSEVTMWVAMHSDLLVAASLASPSATPTWYLFNSLRDNFVDSVRKSWGLGPPAETLKQWSQISPAFNVDRIAVPMLFQMSEQEYLVSLDYAVPLISGRRADMYVFPQEPHVKFQPRHKLVANERNLDWFRYWLLGEEDPDEAKHAQYAHWRSMKEVAEKHSR